MVRDTRLSTPIRRSTRIAMKNASTPLGSPGAPYKSAQLFNFQTPRANSTNEFSTIAAEEPPEMVVWSGMLPETIQSQKVTSKRFSFNRNEVITDYEMRNPSSENINLLRNDIFHSPNHIVPDSSIFLNSSKNSSLKILNFLSDSLKYTFSLMLMIFSCIFKSTLGSISKFELNFRLLKFIFKWLLLLVITGFILWSLIHSHLFISISNIASNKDDFYSSLKEAKSNTFSQEKIKNFEKDSDLFAIFKRLNTLEVGSEDLKRVYSNIKNDFKNIKYLNDKLEKNEALYDSLKALKQEILELSIDLKNLRSNFDEFKYNFNRGIQESKFITEDVVLDIIETNTVIRDIVKKQLYSNLPEFLPFKAGEDGESLFFDSKLKKAIQNVAWNNNPDFLNLKQEVESMKSLIHNFINSPENVENVEASLDRKTLSTMISDALQKYSSDGIGMPDYALASLGTKVISALTTGPYLGESIFMGTSSELGKVFGNFALESLLYPLRSLFGKTSLKSQPPWIAITPDNSPGNCYSFPGQYGKFTIKLPKAIIPTAFSIDHLSKFNSIDLSSAPKYVEIFGFNDENDLFDSSKLSEYYYDAFKNEAIQTFPCVTNCDRHFRYFQLKINSNHGSAEYTCLYRFRVHSNKNAKL